MLEDSLFESHGRQKTRKPITVVISAAAHVVTVVVLVLIPLLQTRAITVPSVDLSLWLPKAEPPKTIEIVSAQPRVQKRIQPNPDVLTEPVAIPKGTIYVDEPVVPALNLPPSSGSNVTGLVSDLFNPRTETVTAPPVPPPPPPPPPVKIERLRRGGVVQQANLIHQVNPVYPHLARITRVHGVVQLEAVISREGTVQSLRVIAGHPLLTQAALDAVQQWRYRPTLLNGEPVEVVTTVTVTFTLQ